jgi:hypothetical protein
MNQLYTRIERRGGGRAVSLLDMVLSRALAIAINIQL